MVSQIIGSIFHAPLFTQASNPPYKDMKITIGTTIQQETAITFFIVLLSGFTQDGQGLLVGTNLGGLGTLIASLASLISFRYYLRLEGAKPLRYLGVFTGLNLAGLAVLTSLALCLSLW